MPPIAPGRRAGHARGQTAYSHPPRAARFAVLAILVFVVTTAAGWRGTSHPARSAPSIAPVPTAEQVIGRPAADQAATGRLPRSAPARSQFVAIAAGRPVLSLSAPRSCPPAASACADLSANLTWLQSDGKITYGPVRMLPGRPGTQDATPRGTFRVQWKAGARYVSTEYHELIPYAVFFAPGGIAFHGGSLTMRSHGCIHLDIDSARYYHDHLPVGAEVVVF